MRNPRTRMGRRRLLHREVGVRNWMHLASVTTRQGETRRQLAPDRVGLPLVILHLRMMLKKKIL